MASVKRIFGFDVARAFSMFYIIGILHLSGYTVYSVSQNAAFVSLIWSTLGVFTFLSAFLLASKYGFENGKATLQFYKKRVLRFYPLFFISSLLLVLIHFNPWSETWKGLLGISPFWKPQQHTLWYIATLIFLYLITPLLSCQKFGFFLKSAIFGAILAAVLAIASLFHSVDPRFFYYYIVYFLGILCATYKREQTMKIFHSQRTLWLLILYIPVFVYLLLTHNRPIMMLEGYIGIPVIMSLSMLFADRFNSSGKVVKVIDFVSYGSMCAYLFHREIYWLFLLPVDVTIWGGWKLAYLFFIALPIVLIVSYYIQKFYDSLFQKRAGMSR